MDLTDRRRADDRRLANLGPPIGLGERRLNMERRVFDLGLSVTSARLPVGTASRTIIREGLRETVPEGIESPAYQGGFGL
jgi:hypothetical protein